MEIKRTLGTDDETGLTKQIRVKNIKIDLEKSVISVNCAIELVSNGVVVKELGEYPYYREDTSGENPKTEFTDTANTEVGMAIQGMLQNDLAHLNL